MLNDTQKRLILDWFQAKAPRRACPVCGHPGGFLIDPELIGSTPLGYRPDQGFVREAARTAAFLVLRCPHCAHVQLFDAVAMGVIQPLPPPPKTDRAGP